MTFINQSGAQNVVGEASQDPEQGQIEGKRGAEALQIICAQSCEHR
jgi:hypothetical protein